MVGTSFLMVAASTILVYLELSKMSRNVFKMETNGIENPAVQRKPYGGVLVYSSSFFTRARHLWAMYSERSLLVTKVWLLYRPWWPESM